MIKVSKEIWQDKDGNAVPYGDFNGVSVLLGEGVSIDAETAKRIGLNDAGELPAVERAGKTGTLSAPPANKAKSGPEAVS